MRRFVAISLTVLFVGGLAAGEPDLVETELSARTAFLQQLNHHFEENGSQHEGDLEINQGWETRSVALGTFLSAAVPGSGQFYNGSYLKAVAFLAVEVGALFGHFHYQSRGNDLEHDFERFADANWVESDYWDWMSQVSGIARGNMGALRDFEHDTFSHFLPKSKGQQYYENIGKYSQFLAGWVDFEYSNFSLEIYRSASHENSDLREDYTIQRKDANDQFRTATTLATVAILNHVLSAFDAGLSIRNHNRKVEATLGVEGKVFHEKYVPTLNLAVRW